MVRAARRTSARSCQLIRPDCSILSPRKAADVQSIDDDGRNPRWTHPRIVEGKDLVLSKILVARSLILTVLGDRVERQLSGVSIPSRER